MKQRLSTLGLKIVVSTRSTGTENRIFKGGAMKNSFRANLSHIHKYVFKSIKKTFSISFYVNRSKIKPTWFGFIQIEVLNWIGLIFSWFASNEIQNIFQIGSETNLVMIRNSFALLGLNSNLRLSTGISLNEF